MLFVDDGCSTKLGTYEVLIGDSRAIRWVDAHGPLKPAGLGYCLVEGGYDETGFPMYIAQANHKEGLFPGKASETLDGKCSDLSISHCLYRLGRSILCVPWRRSAREVLQGFSIRLILRKSSYISKSEHGLNTSAQLDFCSIHTSFVFNAIMLPKTASVVKK